MGGDLAILGATGSIGESALQVLRGLPGRFKLVSISGGSNWKRLAEVAHEFKPAVVAIADADSYPRLKDALSGLGCKVLAGCEGVVEAASACGAKTLLSAAVGEAGLLPTFAAVEAGMDIALANKETMVMAGSLITKAAKRKNIKILPVDSEHSALFQCLQCGAPHEVERLVLTASGGPFRGKSKEALRHVTAEDALRHPTWKMGSKITVDSATLANKALEVIEAHWLFNVPFERISVVVHPQSIIHSMVDFTDGMSVAQAGLPDMMAPIQYALTWPERKPGRIKNLDLAAIGKLTFEQPDREAFPCLELGYEAGRRGGLAQAVYSAANEEAVGLFLAGKIGFLEIADRIEDALQHCRQGEAASLDEVREISVWARERVAGRRA